MRNSFHNISILNYYYEFVLLLKAFDGCGLGGACN